MKPPAVLCALLWPVVLAAAPLPRPYVVEHYDVRVVPDLAAKRLAGEASIRICSRIETLNAVELDAGGLEVTGVAEGSKAQYFERRGSLLIVALDRPARNEERRTLTIRYTAGPAKGLVFYPDQVYGSFFTSDWMPCDDRPEDRASLRLVVDPAPGSKVAASGRFDGTAWLVDPPSATFLFAFAAGSFAESSSQVNGVTLRVLGKANVLEPAAAVMKFLIERTGKAYPGETYTQVLVHGDLQRPAAGLTILPESYAAELAAHPADVWLVADELAHQWYGIGVPTRDWSDLWLSEGISAYLADAFLEQRYGKARYNQEIERSRGIYEAARREGEDRPLSFSDWQTAQQADGPVPVHKGAWVLAELRRQLGDEIFWRGLRAYTAGHWENPVTSGDFQRSMQHAAGKDLGKLFERWVY